MRTRQSQTQQPRKDKEEDGSILCSPPPPSSLKNPAKPDIVFDFDSPVETLRSVAQISAPDFSLIFGVFIIAITYFHEYHFTKVAVVLSVWFTVQIVAHSMNDDFKNDLFWNILTLLGNFVLYLFCGYIWSMAKLYIDIRQGHLDPTLITRIRECVSTDQTGCIIPLLMDMKWMIVRWMTTWPISLVRTLLRDPFNITIDFIYTSSLRRYYAIMGSAIGALDMHDSLSTDAATSWSTVVIYLAYVVGYFAIGYVWTHVKLFVDVWQGALPLSLDQQVRDAYDRKIGYWAFVKQIKWHVTSWMIVWPFSIFYTLLRHPLRILVDFVYELSQRKLAWIVEKAMFWRMKKD